AAVDLTVVDPVGRLVGLRIVDERALAGPEIEGVEAVGERADGAVAVLADGDRADLRRNVPGADLASVGRRAKDAAMQAVDPVEPLLLDVPERPLAEGGLDVDENLDAHGEPPLSYPLKRGSGRPCTPRPCTAKTKPASLSLW